MQSVDPFYKLPEPAGGTLPAAIHLSDREKTVLQCLCKELIAKQTAVVIHASTRSVETCLKRLRRKTGCHNMIGLAKFAMRLRIYIDPEDTNPRNA